MRRKVGKIRKERTSATVLTAILILSVFISSGLIGIVPVAHALGVTVVGGFHWPLDIAAMNGNYYVADTDADLVRAFNSANQQIWTCDANDPMGIGVGNGLVYVVDGPGPNRIMWININTGSTVGSYVFDIEGGGFAPNDVAVAPDGNIYVTSIPATGLVRIYNPSFTSFTTLADTTIGCSHIDIDDDGNVFITYGYGTNMVKEFPAIEGGPITFSSMLGFNDPQGIAVDGSYVYVVEDSAHRVQQFLSSTGASTGVWWGGFGTDPGEFSYPRGIAADGGKVYVADSDNNRIQIFNSASSGWVYAQPNEAHPGQPVEIFGEVTPPGIYTLAIRVTQPDGSTVTLGPVTTDTSGDYVVDPYPTFAKLGTYTAEVWDIGNPYVNLGYTQFNVVEPDEFLVTQGGNSWIVEPIYGTASASSFYDYVQETPDQVITTSVWILGTAPDPVGLDQPILLYAAVAPAPPTGQVFHGVELVVWRYDEVQSMWTSSSYFSDTSADGMVYFGPFVLSSPAWYYFQVCYLGEILPNGGAGIACLGSVSTGIGPTYIGATPTPKPAAPASLTVPPLNSEGSGHCSLMEADKSKIYLYEAPDGELSLIIHHGKDDPTSPQMWLAMSLLGLPYHAYSALSDDVLQLGEGPPEFGPYVSNPLGNVAGSWRKRAGFSDGAILSGLEITNDWELSIQFLANIAPAAWEYQADSTTAYTLNMDTATAGPVRIRPMATLGGLTVTNFVIAPPTRIPDTPWSYSLGQGGTVIQEFPLAAAGEDSRSIGSLEPGEYWIAQAHKDGYNPRIDVGESSVWADKTSITIVANGETQVSFVNTLEGWEDPSWTPVAIGKHVEGLDFQIPENRPVPIQAAWNVDLFNDNNNERIDLVTGKPMQILVNLQPGLTAFGHIDLHVSGMGNPNGYDKAVQFADYQESSDIFMLTTPIVPIAGSYVISGYYTVDDNPSTMTQLFSTPVSVKDTVPLALYFTTLSRSKDYGTEDSSNAVYGEMVTQSLDFVKATYPLNLNTLKSDTAWKKPTAGSAYSADYPAKALSADCTAIAQAAYNAYGKSGISYRGIGIGPMIAGKPDYFTYNGRPGAGGIRFAGIKGVVALDGCWDAVAHELGHTYGLYVPTPQNPTQLEEYNMTEYQPDGKTASGVWVQAGTWATGYDFMSFSHYRNANGTWVNHDTYEYLFNAMLSNPNPADPEVLWTSGIIYKDPINGVKIEANTNEFPWYDYHEGYTDVLDATGDYALIFLDANGDPIGNPTRFAASFTMQVDPIFRVGQDISYEGFGTVPIDFAPFAFATQLPQGTAEVEVVEDMINNPTHPTLLTTVDVDDVADFAYSSSGLSIKNGDTFKFGTTVPIKFQLMDPTGSYFITTATAEAYVAKITGGVPGSFIPAPSGSEPKTGNLFRYDSAKNQYIFNLDTRRLTKGTWRFRVELDDGNLFEVDIIIK